MVYHHWRRSNHGHVHTAMRILLLLLPSVLLAQPQNLEDWNCASGAIPTAGNPTIFTCSEPHNYPAGTRVAVWNASGGSWPNMNTQWNAYLRLDVDASTPTQFFVNDTLYFPQTGNFPISFGLGEQVLVNVADSDKLNVVTRGYNGTVAAAHPLDDQVLGPYPTVPASYAITSTGANTFTIPFDSTGYGIYSGNPVKLQRSSFTYTSTPDMLPLSFNGSGANQLGGQPTANHTWDIVIPACVAPSSANQSAAFECARGYNDPGGLKGYGAKGAISTLVVSSGTGVVTLTTGFVYNGQQGNSTLAANQLVWIQGMVETPNSFNQINRPWIMSAVNGGLTQITIPGMGGQGVADGTYTPSGSGPWVGQNFWLESTPDLDWYLEGDSSGGYPFGYTQQLLKDGPAFNVLDNRVAFTICWGKDFTPFAANTGVLELGNYIALQPSGSANHGYQSLNINGYSGQCGLYTFTALSTHFVNQNDPVYNPNDPTSTPIYAPSLGWTGETGNHFWEIVNRFYMNGPGLYADFSGQTIKMGAMTMDYIQHEPEEYVISRGVIYNGTGYDVNLEINQPGIAATSYQFRHSTTNMKSAGFSTGLCKSGTTTCSGADSLASDQSGANPFLAYTSAALASANTIYWGIRPTIPISGTTGNSVSPIWINTDYNPNFQVGDKVTVAGLSGNTAANQTNVAVTGVAPRATWFYTLPSATWPTGAVAGTLTNIISDGTTCTVNFSVSHGLTVGWRIVVYSTVTGDGTHGYRYTVATVPSANSLTYACPGSIAATYAADLSGFFHMQVVAEDGFSIAGTGNGNWAGETTGTVIATDDTKNFAQITFTQPGTTITSTGRAIGGAIRMGGSISR